MATILSPNSRYSFNCKWEFVGKSIDVDLQAIVVNQSGYIVDAAYYNSLKACGKAITHTGYHMFECVNVSYS